MLIPDHYRKLFRTPPYRHQEYGINALVENEFFGLFDEMGVGKSKQVVDAACVLASEGRIDTVLIVSPAAVRSVWLNKEMGEIKKHAWLPCRVTEFHAKSNVVWKDAGPRLDWLVTNYEFIRAENHREHLLSLLYGRKVLMVLDESSFIKSRQAAQTKACVKIGRTVDRRVILNGTPVANNPLDLWSQMNFLSPRILPYKNFFHFRSEFAVMGGWHNHQILEFKNLDRLQQHVAPYVVRREKKDCLDLPDKIYTQLEVPLSPESWKVYKQMRDEAVVWLNENPTLASQAGVRVMRLSQITSGFLGGFLEDCHAGDQNVDVIEKSLGSSLPQVVSIGREKLDLLRGWVTERLAERPDLKVIVWCRFRAELERLAADLKDLLPTYRLYGQAAAERKEAIERFSRTDDPTPALLAAQPQAGGFGLNLVAADTVVYLSNTYSLMSRLQSEDRVHRPGQTKHVVYLDVVATGPNGQKTVDHAVLTALRKKDDLAKWTVAAWRQALEEE